MEEVQVEMSLTVCAISSAKHKKVTRIALYGCAIAD